MTEERESKMRRSDESPSRFGELPCILCGRTVEEHIEESGDCP